MTPLDKLVALAEIRQVAARRILCVDRKDWAGFARCHAPDAVTDTYKSLGSADAPIVGPDAIAAQIAKALGDRVTATQLHEPDIEFTSETTAVAVWPCENRNWWEDGGQKRWSRAYNLYREAYEKIGERWLIKSRSVTRLRYDEGVEAG
jgi:hypothetical protein